MDSLAPASLTPEQTDSLLSALGDASPYERELLEEQLVAGHHHLIERMARRYAHRGIDVEDLRQVATLAVLNAIRRFDPERGNFVAFASVTIAGELKRHFRDHGWLVRPPRSLQELQAEISNVTEEHRGAEQTVAVLAAELDVQPERIREAQYARNGFRGVSIDSPTRGPDGNQRLSDTLGAEESAFEFIDSWSDVPSAWHKLSPEQRQLLELRFYRDLSQDKIAKILGISQMQVSRRLRAVLTLLREQLAHQQVA